MDPSFENLLTEKNDLERALGSVSDLLQQTTLEKEQLHKLFTDLKAHFDTIKTQCGAYQRRLVDELTSKRDLETHYEQRLLAMTAAIDSKQQELERLSHKLQLPVDTDLLRMRVTKDVEGRFRLDLETKTQELERVTEAYFETKRQLEVYRTSLENHRYESDKIVTDLRSKHRSELDELVEEN